MMRIYLWKRQFVDLMTIKHIVRFSVRQKQLGSVANQWGLRGTLRKNNFRFELIQPINYLVKRQARVEILPLAVFEKFELFPYCPLGA